MPDVYLYPAYDVYDLLEALEVDDDVVVYLDAREPLHHRPGLVDAPVGVGGVDLVFHPRFDLDVEVARDGEQLDLPRGRRYPNEHHRVRAGGLALGRAGPLVYTQNEHVEGLVGRFVELLLGRFLLGPAGRLAGVFVARSCRERLRRSSIPGCIGGTPARPRSSPPAPEWSPRARATMIPPTWRTQHRRIRHSPCLARSSAGRCGRT